MGLIRTPTSCRFFSGATSSSSSTSQPPLKSKLSSLFKSQTLTKPENPPPKDSTKTKTKTKTDSEPRKIRPRPNNHASPELRRVLAADYSSCDVTPSQAIRYFDEMVRLDRAPPMSPTTARATSSSQAINHFTIKSTETEKKKKIYLHHVYIRVYFKSLYIITI